MRKNPVTKPARGRRKPSYPKVFVVNFRSIYLIFASLGSEILFGVLMRWVMTIKDHCTGLVYLCALPHEHPKLVVYKLQEIFGAIGYPKMFHTNNGKEFTGKIIHEFLCDMNPNILKGAGHPWRPTDQGSVENMN
jgi:hypothetical protein